MYADTFEVQGSFKLVEVTLNSGSSEDLSVRVVCDAFKKELGEVEKELQRINGPAFGLQTVPDLYPGMRCVTFDKRMR